MRTLPGPIACMLAVLAFDLIGAIPARADDGVGEINQACVASGCLPGDGAGFPVTITASGSYRLTGNLTLPDASTTGILIEASHVTLDLNGFSIEGVTVCEGKPVTGCDPTGQGEGIETSTGLNPDDVAVLNGTVRGAGSFGIILRGSGSRIERVRAVSNGLTGLSVGGNTFGSAGTVKDCTSTQNGNDGIFLGDEGLAQGNVAMWNKRHGLMTRNASAVLGNTMNRNTEYGLLNSGGAPSGYASNVITTNGVGTVSGMVEIGANLCDGDTTCP